MMCPRCQRENPATVKFCGECGARLDVACSACRAPNPPTNKFCHECGAPMGPKPAAGPLASPESYTPKHLAEKILTSKAALEGERKQVTVLFADLKGSMELLADRDPEEARKLLDPVVEHMMEAVHRYEGTVNRVMGDGIMALFGAPIAHEDHALRACYAALRMQAAVTRYADGVRRERRHDPHPRGIEFRRRGRPRHRQRPPHGLHRGGADHPSGRTHGAGRRTGFGASPTGDPRAVRRLRSGQGARANAGQRVDRAGRGLR